MNAQVHVKGGEIGIRVTGMDVTFIGCCTEGMDVTANGTNLPWPKQVLQPDDVGVGLWLQNGDCNRSDAGGNNVIIDFYSEATVNPLRIMDKYSVSVHGAFLMDPGGGVQHPDGKHHGKGWAAVYSRNTMLTMDGVWGYWAGVYGVLAVGTTLRGDSVGAFPVTRSSAIADPLAQHHRCLCTVDSASDCDSGQRHQSSRCYLATCPTGTDDGFRGCTCAWKQVRHGSPPHGCTAEVHCVVKDTDKPPPNCTRQQFWRAPTSPQLLYYSWDPRSGACLNATIACTAAVDYHCGARGTDGSVNPAECEACTKQPSLASSLRLANCTEQSVRAVCHAGARGSTMVQQVRTLTIDSVD